MRARTPGNLVKFAGDFLRTQTHYCIQTAYAGTACSTRSKPREQVDRAPKGCFLHLFQGLRNKKPDGVRLSLARPFLVSSSPLTWETWVRLPNERGHVKLTQVSHVNGELETKNGR